MATDDPMGEFQIIVFVREAREEDIFDQYLEEMNRLCLSLGDAARAFGEAAEVAGVQLAELKRELNHRVEVDMRYLMESLQHHDIDLVDWSPPPLHWRDIKTNPMPASWAPLNRPTAHPRRGHWMMHRRPVA